MKFAAAIATFTALVAPAAAAAIQSRDVFAPKVLNPHAGTVWHKGEVRPALYGLTARSLILPQKHNVTWDISHIPKQITNSDGLRIQLRYDSRISPCALRLFASTLHVL
jgi:hypothetical protein